MNLLALGRGHSGGFRVSPSVVTPAPQPEKTSELEAELGRVRLHSQEKPPVHRLRTALDAVGGGSEASGWSASSLVVPSCGLGLGQSLLEPRSLTRSLALQGLPKWLGCGGHLG